MAVSVSPGTIVVYTDVVCAWSTLALHRFYQQRAAAGAQEALLVDHRLFLLEDLNSAPVPKRHVDAELPVVGALAPEFGWTPWQRDPAQWPITALLPNEAVHAAKRQSLRAAEQLDMALRRAFFCDSRPISMLHEVVDIARGCEAVDAAELQAALDGGLARSEMMRDYRENASQAQGSPHFFLADGSSVHNPGIEIHQVGQGGAGFPVVDRDDPAAMADLLQQALATTSG